MPLIYDFIFTAADYAGQAASVRDAAGDEVAGSPFSLDAAGRLSLPLDEGTYSAMTANAGRGLGNAHADGVLNVPASIAAGGGGGGGDTASRGILYLKATATGLDVSAEEWGGNGEDLPYSLDTDRASGVPDWITVVGDTFHITERGMYLTQTAAKGVLTFPDAPEDIQFDIVAGNHNVLSTFINLGWYSDGSDDSDAFTPAEVNELEFLCKDGWNQVIPDGGGLTFPIVLTGLRGDNYTTPSTTGAVLDADIRVAIIKLGAGPRYTEADLP